MCTAAARRGCSFSQGSRKRPPQKNARSARAPPAGSSISRRPTGAAPSATCVTLAAAVGANGPSRSKSPCGSKQRYLAPCPALSSVKRSRSTGSCQSNSRVPPAGLPSSMSSNTLPKGRSLTVCAPRRPPSPRPGPSKSSWGVPKKSKSPGLLLLKICTWLVSCPPRIVSP